MKQNTKTSQSNREKKNSKKSLKLSLIITLSTLGLFWGIFVAAVNYYSNFIPNLDQLEKITPALTTQVFDDKNNLIKEYYIEKREITPIDSMPEYLVNGLVAVEDRNFFSHWGVDMANGVVRAVYYQIVKGKSHGGSTITQQLGRNLFLDQEHSIARKMKEAITAFYIERTYSKSEIIEFYLNEVNFGGAYGIQAASKRFYSKKVNDLTIDEAAIFIGMLKAPNSYRPDLKPEKSKMRRNIVLGLMYKQGVITKGQYEENIKKAIKVNPTKPKSDIAPYFFEDIRSYVIDKYGSHTLYNKGIKIYTTLNSDFQKETENSMKKNLAHYQKEMNTKFYTKYLKQNINSAPKSFRNIELDSLLNSLDTILYGKNKKINKWIKTISIPSEDTLVTVQGSFIAVDSIGAIKTLIGGRDFNESEYNRVFSKRQPGSTFKTFVYLTGLLNNYTAGSIILDQPLAVKTGKDDIWTPATHGVKGPVIYSYALANSLNLATLYLFNKLGGDKVINTAKMFQLDADYQNVPSLALGVFELSLYQMVRAYSVFQNEGKMNKLHFIKKIEDSDGNTLEEFLPETKQLIPKDVNYTMDYILGQTIKIGTAKSALSKGFTHPAGGKTGTTNSSIDNWFIGFTKNYTAGCWVGTDINRKMGNARSGATTALPIWTDFMIKAHDSLPHREFTIPENIEFKDICSKSGKLSTSNCLDINYNVPFIAGTTPQDSCYDHEGYGKNDTKRDSDVFGTEAIDDHLDF